MKLKSIYWRISALVLLALAASACTGGEQAVLKMAPLHEMPADVQSAPVTVREAYQFAVANPEVTRAIPCYCGCGAMGHTSNYACYASGQDTQGQILFDNHALGCSICVDITQDAMRMSREGQDIAAIRSYIDSTYAQYGPSNMEP